jgi:glycosyltransferase involved in cell wall biosynthesis
VTQVAGLVRAAAESSLLTHRVCFLDGAGETADALESEGLVVCRLGFRRGWGVVGLVRLALVVRSTRARVVHFHWPALGPILVSMAAAPRSAFVWTEHHPGALLRQRRFRIFYALFRRRFSRFVVPSKPMAQCVESYGVERARIRLVPNGLTVPLREPTDVPAGAGRVVGVLTRLDRLKRVDLFVDTVAELRSRGVDCVGVVVGDGGQRAALEEHAGSRGVRDVVEFVGMKNDVVTSLDRFDVFLTTTSIESFGLAVLEAMARAVPVVAMPCPGGLGELVGRGGVLLPDRSVAFAADVVAQLLASPESRRELGLRGWEVAAGYTLEAALAALDRLYGELMAAARR